jgi:glutamine amidotransferase
VSDRSHGCVTIVDYGTGNLNSVRRCLERLATEVRIASSASDVAEAEKIILPGVGHFDRAMETLGSTGMLEALNESVLTNGTTVLGICLGMELMGKRSEEGTSAGLGWLNAEAVRLKIPRTSRYKVPHMGWNAVRVRKASRLMSGLDDGAEFYFAHSYYLEVRDAGDLLCSTEYEVSFASAVEKENIFGVQFHPEKSHDAGMRLLKNFVEL